MEEYPQVSLDEAKRRFASWLEETDRELYTIVYMMNNEKYEQIGMHTHFSNPKIKSSSDFVAHKKMMKKLGQVNTEPMSKDEAACKMWESMDNMCSEPIEVIRGLDLNFGMIAVAPKDEAKYVQAFKPEHRSMKEAEAEYRRMVREEEELRSQYQAIKSAKERGEGPPPLKAKRQRVDWDDLEELHNQHNGDTEMIAQIKGCSNAAVQRMYRINKWEITRKSSAGRRGREAQYDWSNLESLREQHNGNTEAIAVEMGCSAAAVDRRFRQNEWEIKKPKKTKIISRRGGKRGYSAEEEVIIRQGVREDKTNEEIVEDLAAAGFERTVHAVMYCRTRKFADEKKFAGKVRLFKGSLTEEE